MSAYIKLSTLEYPRYQGDIRLEYPAMGAEFVCPETYALVEEVVAPEFDYATQTAYQLPPVNANGIWSMAWAVRDLTAEEVQGISYNPSEPDPAANNATGSTPNVIG